MPLMTWATHVLPDGNKEKRVPARVSKPHKTILSSDCSLQLDYMKLESLVIANQNVAVNTFLSCTPPAHTREFVTIIMVV